MVFSSFWWFALSFLASPIHSMRFLLSGVGLRFSNFSECADMCRMCTYTEIESTPFIQVGTERCALCTFVWNGKLENNDSFEVLLQPAQSLCTPQCHNFAYFFIKKRIKFSPARIPNFLTSNLTESHYSVDAIVDHNSNQVIAINLFSFLFFFSPS